MMSLSYHRAKTRSLNLGTRQNLDLLSIGAKLSGSTTKVLKCLDCVR